MNFIIILITLILLINSSLFPMKRIFRSKSLATQQNNKTSTKNYLHEQLFKSIQCKQHVEVKKALQMNADPNIFDSSRKTPLYYAVTLYDYNSIELLLEAGALCNLELPGNISLIHILAKSELNEISLRILELLIKNNAPHKTLSDTGFTPLHFAITNEASSQENKILGAKLLLRDVTSYNETTKTGLTPLHLTITIAHNDKLAQFFIDSPETEINAQTNEQQTPLICAVQYGMLQTMKALLSNQAIETMHTDAYGKSALYYAKYYKKKEIGKLLITHLALYSSHGLIAKQGLMQIFPESISKIIASEYIKSLDIKKTY